MPQDGMMDAIERQVYGPAAGDAPVRDRIGFVEDTNVADAATGGVRDRTAELGPDGMPVESFMPPPDNSRQLTPEQLEERWKQQTRTFTQTQQQLRERERQFIEATRQAQELQARYVDAMQRMQAAPATPQTAANTDPLRHFQDLNPDDLDPQTRLQLRTLSAAMERVADEKLRGLQTGPDPAFQQHLQALETRLAKREAREKLDVVRREYGDEVIQQFGPQMEDAFMRFPDLNPEQAVGFFANQAIAAKALRDAQAAAQRTQRQTQDSYDRLAAANLIQGGRPSPGAAPGEIPYKSGESFADSFRAATGRDPRNFDPLV